jgi:histidinol-phosphatase
VVARRGVLTVALVDDLALARHLAAIADVVSLHHAERGVRIDYKADGSYVTTADLAVDRAIREELAMLRPDDAVLTEEHGAAGRASSNRRWLIDPLDGTSWFVDRTPHWGAHISLEIDGEIELAVISRPALGLSWFGSRGGGAFRSDAPEVPLRVTTTSSLREARISGYVSYWSDVVDDVQAVSTWVRDPAPTLALLDGRIDAVVGDGGYAWDLAPSAVLVPEAGGVFADPYGGTRIDLQSSVSTNAALHDSIVRLVYG